MKKVRHLIKNLERPIDINFSYQKETTIYGMAQIENQDYLISRDKSHVVFPIKYRREAAEAYLIKLVSGKKRRVCCFLMSATGSYENSHIPAWSMEALECLSNDGDLNFLRMTEGDYQVTAEKQKEREKDKTIEFQSLENIQDCDFMNLSEIKRRDLLQKLNESDDGSVDGVSDSIVRQLQTLFNRHKKDELNNLFKGLDVVHNNADYGDDGNDTKFALALTQTNRNLFAMLSLFIQSNGGFLKADNRRYELKNLLGREATGSGGGFGIFELKTKPTGNKFATNKNGKSTLIICYSTAFDKALSKIYKEQVKNPNSPEYKIKKLLGMNPEKTLADDSDTDFNAMNYFLNNIHGYNVYIVSAYQSAARGINLIVNKETGLSLSRKRKKHLSTDLFTTDPKIEHERDLDYIFMASPPYYSELQLNRSDGSSRKASQQRFFASCDKYLHYIEWLARKSHKTLETPKLSTSVDLMSPLEDVDVETYFEQQHHISLFSALQQGLGRIERTNAEQTQTVYLCAGVNEVINNGIRAITEGHDDKNVDQLIGAMSVVNANLIRNVLAQSLSFPALITDNGSISIEAKRHKFEQLKRGYFLKAIKKYREFDNLTDVDEQTKLEIEFYEAFRSTTIWTHGYEPYIQNLEAVLEKMPSGLKRGYRQIVSLLFMKYDAPLTDYLALSGSYLDLRKLYNEKEHAVVDPYCTQVGHLYLSSPVVHSRFGR